MKPTFLFMAATASISFMACGGAATPSNSTANTEESQSEDPCLASELSAEAKGECVLKRFVDATGGIERYAGLKTMHSSATLTIKPMGIEGTMETYSESPSKVVTKMAIKGLGDNVMGMVDEVAWAQDLTGLRLLSEDELEQLKIESDTTALYNWRTYFRSVASEGTEVIEGRTLDKVKLVTKRGRVETRLFDQESGLQVMMRGVQVSPMGEMAVETTFLDYRSYEGFLMPMKLSTIIEGRTITVEVHELKLNGELPAGVFAIPAGLPKPVEKAPSNNATEQPTDAQTSE